MKIVLLISGKILHKFNQKFRRWVSRSRHGGQAHAHLGRLHSPPSTIFFLIVSQLSLLVCLILTYVTIIPIIIRQFRAMLRINRGFILIKESACEVGRGLNQVKKKKRRDLYWREIRKQTSEPRQLSGYGYKKIHFLKVI